MTRVLLAGETFTFAQTAISGASVSLSARRTNGALPFLAALRASGIEVEHLPGERCEEEFPQTADALRAYSAVILSDLSALTILLSPETRAGRVSVNRLALLARYVVEGGGLMMAGGYTSFQGMDGAARFHDTPVEDCLPVVCLSRPDGVEAPEGLVPRLVAAHPIVAGLPATLPPILGLNEVRLREGPDTTLLATVMHRSRSLPLLAIREHGEGRALAFMTDIGPHWMSEAFIASESYPLLMQNMVRWLSREL